VSPQLRLDEANLPDYLRKIGLLGPGAEVRVEPAGDGNINWVRRVRAADGVSWIVKQARPALERFPEYQVTTERIVFEARYNALVAPFDRDGIQPEIAHFDEPERVLVMQDLGPVERPDHALARGSDAAGVAAALGRFLGAVHAGTRDAGLASRFHNDAMRRLHGDHIFVLPLRENAFPLPARLRARADALRRDAALVARADALHARYLEPRGALVHADVQAGNVLLAASGPKLLDAEIAHVGDPAFDLGTLLAHFLLPAVARGDGRAALPAGRAAWDAYREAWPDGGRPGFAQVASYAGIEMLRRSIGAARLAVVEAESAGLAALEVALRLLRAPARDPDELAAQIS
jgi:5-methylthioribose kinase